MINRAEEHADIGVVQVNLGQYINIIRLGRGLLN
jgi:hypothetical protein